MAGENRTLHDSLWRLDGGFSAALATAFFGALITILSALGGAIFLAQQQIRIQLIADTAALVAADTLVGAIAGYPCQNAELIADSDGALLVSCRIVGLVAEIELAKSLGPITVLKSAQAAPGN